MLFRICCYGWLLLSCLSNLSAQSAAIPFLKPSDTLHKGRLQALVLTESALAATAFVALGQVWYKDYAKADFHFIDDSGDWLQVDKAGHAFATYHLSRFNSELLEWAGVDRNRRLVYGTASGFVLVSAIELFDGHSAAWGASWGDLAANAIGSSLFLSQELIWGEQRIIPKFSFHVTPLAKERPELLGASLREQVLKDYNGQTYWLSANLFSFTKTDGIPKWLNVAVGYGANGMLSASAADHPLHSDNNRYRQFYLSIDADLTRIETRSHFLKTVFSVVNTIKIPAPAFEINGRGITKGHWLYF